jgi:hypothetical protein
MTAAERIQLRKSLLQLSSLLLLALLSLALMAQFAVWSLQRAHVRSDRESAHLVAALDASRQTQVQFKRQVQEWKNLLLRGEDPLQRSRYYEAFSGAEARVRAALEAVAVQLHALDDRDHDAVLQSIREQHTALGEHYRAALTSVSGGRWAPFDSDQAVRGMDRPLDTAIDNLANTLLSESVERTAQDQTAMARRYEALRFGLWTAIAAGLGLVGALLWRSLRTLGTAD